MTGTSHQQGRDPQIRPSAIEKRARLAAIRRAARRGERAHGYRLAASLTEGDPENLRAWLWRARLAPARAERLRCLSLVLERRPDHPGARRDLYEALWAELEADPFLDYDGETDHLYRVRTGDDTPVTVPKQRRPPEPFPPPAPGPLRPAWRWLRLALVGLLPAGLGAVLLAPVAAVAALRAGRRALSARDKKARRIALLLASLIWLAGLALAFLFFLHV